MSAFTSITTQGKTTYKVGENGVTSLDMEGSFWVITYDNGRTRQVTLGQVVSFS